MNDKPAETNELEVLKIFPLVDEWGSSKGGVSTLNREMCKGLAQQPNVSVNLVVSEFNEAEKEEALNSGVNLIKADKFPGYDPIQMLSFPPDECKIDVVIGHGRKLGPPANVLARRRVCKRVHVVHTSSEEIAMFKEGRHELPDGEEKHKIEVELSKTADVIMGIGPKLTDSIKSSLRPHKKDEDVIEFTPGIFPGFSEREQAREETKKFLTLVFGRGNKEDFKLKGYDLAARAISGLNDSSYSLIFVGAKEGEQEEVKNSLLKCGISPTQLTVRSYRECRKKLVELFYVADLAIMPSQTEGFGLAALEALSAGLPILVSDISGFGKALRGIPFGKYFVVESNHPDERKRADEWGRAIKGVREKSREIRLEEARKLREYYDRKYKWHEQCAKLVNKLR